MKVKKENDTVPFAIRQKEIKMLVDRLLKNLYSPVKGERTDKDLTFVVDKKKYNRRNKQKVKML